LLAEGASASASSGDLARACFDLGFASTGVGSGAGTGATGEGALEDDLFLVLERVGTAGAPSAAAPPWEASWMGRVQVSRPEL
jgi:hypothetical protein